MEKTNGAKNPRDEVIEFTVRHSAQEVQQAEIVHFIAELGILLWTLDENKEPKRNAA